MNAWVKEIVVFGVTCFFYLAAYYYYRCKIKAQIDDQWRFIEKEMRRFFEKKDLQALTICETCGCVIFKNSENKTDPTIKEKTAHEIAREISAGAPSFETHKIVYRWYCKAHMPKKRRLHDSAQH